MAGFKVCEVDSCDNRANVKHLCRKHYARWLRHGDPTGGRACGQAKPQLICNVGGCDEAHYARGVCYTHYKQWEYHGFSETKLPRSKVGRQPKRYRNRLGYVEFRQTGHPSANRHGLVLEHRAVMSEMLGRPLLAGENVHHRNGDRADNRPENLELWVTLQPSGQRPEDLLAYAHEIIARYGGEAA